MNPRLDWRERQKARQAIRRAKPKPPRSIADPAVPLSEFEGLIKRAMVRTACEARPDQHHAPPGEFCPHCRGKLVGLSDLLAEVLDLFRRELDACD